MTGARSGRRVDSLDALRGLAALAVATLHAAGVGGGGLPGGTGGLISELLETGLAVFFVLSGYLIAGPFVRAAVDGQPWPRLGDYALRRLMRIVPGYWVAFAVTALLISAVHPAQAVTAEWGAGHLQAGDWLAGALFVQNVVPSQAAAAVLPLMWTLCVEIVFYTAVPLVALAARRRRAHTTRVRPRSVLLLVLGVWAGAALLQSQLGALGAHAGGTAYWVGLQLAYLSLFCPGVLLALATTRAAAVSARNPLRLLTRRQVRDFVPLLVVLAMLGAYAVYRSNGGDLGLTPAGEWRRQPAALAALLMVALALTAHGQAWQRWARWLAPLGTISYGVYLYHWVVLRLLVDHHVYPLAVPGWATAPAKIALALALTLPLAALSYWLVERPAMRFAARRGRRRGAEPAVVPFPVGITG